jgi:hypothetical protein
LKPAPAPTPEPEQQVATPDPLPVLASPGADNGRPRAKERAEAFVREQLANGPRYGELVKRDAAEYAEISERTLIAAAERLGAHPAWAMVAAGLAQQPQRCVRSHLALARIAHRRPAAVHAGGFQVPAHRLDDIVHHQVDLGVGGLVLGLLGHGPPSCPKRSARARPMAGTPEAIWDTTEDTTTTHRRFYCCFSP